MVLAQGFLVYQGASLANDHRWLSQECGWVLMAANSPPRLAFKFGPCSFSRPRDATWVMRNVAKACEVVRGLPDLSSVCYVRSDHRRILGAHKPSFVSRCVLDCVWRRGTLRNRNCFTTNCAGANDRRITCIAESLCHQGQSDPAGRASATRAG